VRAREKESLSPFAARTRRSNELRANIVGRPVRDRVTLRDRRRNDIYISRGLFRLRSVRRIANNGPLRAIHASNDDNDGDGTPRSVNDFHGV